MSNEEAAEYRATGQRADHNSADDRYSIRRDLNMEKPVPVSDEEFSRDMKRHAAWLAGDMNAVPIAYSNRSLSRRVFPAADLSSATFFDCDLSAADLTGVFGLLESSLAGADLTNAALPAGVSFGGLRLANDMAGAAVKNAIALLVLCAYTVLTLLSIQDSALFLNDMDTRLPILDVRIGTESFFWLAPPLLLIAVIYNSGELLRWVSTLAKLPAIFPDGRLITEHVKSWPVNVLIPEHFNRLAERYTPSYPLQRIACRFLIWGLVPGVLTLIWLRYLRRHDWSVTYWHILLLVVTVFTTITLRAMVIRSLRKRNWRVKESGQGSLALTFAAIKAIGARRIIAPVAIALIVVPTTSFVVIEREQDQRWAQADGDPPLVGDLRSMVTHIQRQPSSLLRAFVDFIGTADLNYAALSRSSARANDNQLSSPESYKNSTSEAEPPAGSPAILSGARLEGASLRHAWLHEAEIDSAHLQGANLSDANLTFAMAWEAHLQWVHLHNCNMDYINLTDAHLEHARTVWVRGLAARITNAAADRAHFDSASLPFCYFSKSQLNNAVFDKAQIPYSHFDNATMLRASFIGANIKGAVFLKANLNDADLSGANLEGSQLIHANLTGACMENSKLKGAIVTGADFTGANVQNADFSGVDLRNATGLSGSQLASIHRDNELNLRPLLNAAQSEALQEYISGRVSKPATPANRHRVTVHRRGRG